MPLKNLTTETQMLLLFSHRCSTIALLIVAIQEILSDVHFHVHDNPTQWSWRKRGCCLLSSQCFGYLILLDLDFFFFFFWFSYGDYSFGRALKTTVGRGEGEAAGLKDRIKHGGVLQCIKRWRNRETEVFSCSGNIPFLCCLLLFSWLKVRINNR